MYGVDSLRISDNKTECLFLHRLREISSWAVKQGFCQRGRHSSYMKVFSYVDTLTMVLDSQFILLRLGALS